MSNTRTKVIDEIIARRFEPCCDSRLKMLREAMAEVFEAGMDAAMTPAQKEKAGWES